MSAWPHSGPRTLAGARGCRCGLGPGGGLCLPAGRWASSSRRSSSLQGTARVRTCQSAPCWLPPPSTPCSPSIRRREKTNFSSENIVVLKGTQVGRMAQLLTLPCLGREQQLSTPGPGLQVPGLQPLLVTHCPPLGCVRLCPDVSAHCPRAPSPGSCSGKPFHTCLIPCFLVVSTPSPLPPPRWAGRVQGLRTPPSTGPGVVVINQSPCPPTSMPQFTGTCFMLGPPHPHSATAGEPEGESRL